MSFKLCVSGVLMNTQKTAKEEKIYMILNRIPIINNI